MTLSEARGYLAEGVHFGAGSMAPKIEACVAFLEAGGTEAVISSPENLELAFHEKAGTHIVHD
jgi:carbamate kinase